MSKLLTMIKTIEDSRQGNIKEYWAVLSLLFKTASCFMKIMSTIFRGIS